MAEDWGGWSPHEAQRRATVDAMTPLERIEWLADVLRFWGEDRLLAERRARQAAIDAVWGVDQPAR